MGFRSARRPMHGCGWWLLGVLLSQPVAGNVLTESLRWQTATLESGLVRLKVEFLDISADQDVEFVGAVLRTKTGWFRFTQGQGRAGQDQVTFRIRLPVDSELIGFWHTHGAEGPARGVFSATDAALVQSAGLPFYLITPDGEIRVLLPGTRPVGEGRALLRPAARCPSGGAAAGPARDDGYRCDQGLISRNTAAGTRESGDGRCLALRAT